VRKLLAALGLAIVAAIVGFFVLSSPFVFDLWHGAVAAVPADRKADVENGRVLFNAGGCPSCHISQGQEDRLKLGGGLGLRSPFGTFYVPNISSDARDGIGNWSVDDFVRAMRRGVSPDGRQYYPAFPYTSYQRIAETDLADLFAFLKTLPAVQGRIRDHDLPFPFSIRRSVAFWKLLFMDGQRWHDDPARDVAWNRGGYLVNGPGHCAECHSPRNVLGAIVADKRFSGGPNPEGEGTVPNITPDESGLKSWSKSDIVSLLKTGFTPEYDSVGGSMGAVIKNVSQLSDADLAAMASYLAALPPIASPPKAK